MSTVAGTPQPGNQPGAGVPQSASPPAAAVPQSASPPAAGPGLLRAAWVALFLIFGIIVGTAAGALAFAGGLNVPGALLAGGGAFSATVLLSLALYKFATGEKSN
jgi:hypothetical protein